MNFIGRKIYFELLTGNVILDTGEMMGSVRETTIDEDFSTYRQLFIRQRYTVGVKKLAYGDYAQDFAQCNGYRINPDTQAIEFSYPDPNIPTPNPEPVYQKPLTEQIKILNEQLAATNADLAGLMELIANTQGGV